MKHIATIMMIRMLKAFPIISNIYMLVSITLNMMDISIDKYVFDFFGSSLYMVAICFISSYIFHFCSWYRVLCLSSFISLLVEWVDLVIIPIPCFFYVIQAVITIAILVSLILYVYEQRINKSNNKGSKKID